LQFFSRLLSLFLLLSFFTARFSAHHPKYTWDFFARRPPRRGRDADQGQAPPRFDFRHLFFIFFEIHAVRDAQCIIAKLKHCFGAQRVAACCDRCFGVTWAATETPVGRKRRAEKKIEERRSAHFTADLFLIYASSFFFGLRR
jgi:hypothetical protein